MAYVYPLKNIIETPALEEFTGSMYDAVAGKKSFPLNPELIKTARQDFFREVKRGEQELHRLASRIFSEFMPEQHNVLWYVMAQCEKRCTDRVLKRFVPLTTELYNHFLNDLSDAQRTIDNLPECPNCKGNCLPVKSFFGYENGDEKKFPKAELRIKESSAKITDKLFGLRPRRKDSIPNCEDIGEVVQDLFGIRIIADSIFFLFDIAKYCKGIMQNPTHVKAYMGDKVKGNGYSADHEIGRTSSIGPLCEIQLRTVEAHRHAESKDDPASHFEREKDIIKQRLSTPRWPEANEIVRKVFSPGYLFSLSSE